MFRYGKWIFIGFFSFLILPFVLLTIPKVNYFAYKQLLFDFLYSEHKQETAVLTAKYINRLINEHAYTIVEADSIDRDSYFDLFRGIFWCDQKSWLLGKLLGRGDIENRMVMTRNRQGLSQHTVSELELGGRWIYFDPTLGLSGFDLSPEHPPSVAELCENSQIFSRSKYFDGARKFAPKFTKNFLDFWTERIFYKGCSKPDVWGNPYKKLDAKRKVVVGIFSLYERIFGKTFIYLAQDVYLNMFPETNLDAEVKLDINKPGQWEYFLGRNYQLFERNVKAEEFYSVARNLLPPGNWKEAADFFSAVNFLNLGKEPVSLIKFVENVLQENPKQRWANEYLYLLGRIHLKSHDNAQAISYFKAYLKNAESLQDSPIFRAFDVANILLDLEKTESQNRLGLITR